MFRDIHPLMADPKGRKLVIDHLVERYKDKQIDAIIGLESRGKRERVTDGRLLFWHSLGL